MGVLLVNITIQTVNSLGEKKVFIRSPTPCSIKDSKIDPNFGGYDAAGSQKKEMMDIIVIR